MVDLTPLRQALQTLEAALAKPSVSDLERDGTIQRFEYTFELCWKMMRRGLVEFGRAQVSASPRPIIRAACEEGFIVDVMPWFRFLEARNQIAHIYNEQQADEVYRVARELPDHAHQLIEQLGKVFGA